MSNNPLWYSMIYVEYLTISGVGSLILREGNSRQCPSQLSSEGTENQTTTLRIQMSSILFGDTMVPIKVYDYILLLGV